MRKLGRSCLPALVAGALLLGLSAEPSLAREPKPLFSWPQDLTLPWQAETKPARRGKRRSQRIERATAVQAAPPLPRPAPGRKLGATPSAAEPAGPPEPAAGPPTTEPRAATRAQAEAWKAVKAQLPAPPQPLLLPPEGPAPAPAKVLGFAALRPAPFPPVRTAPRPEASAQAMPGQARAVPLPPERPADLIRVAALPRAPLAVPPAAPAARPGAAPHAQDPECARLAAEGVAVFEPLPAISGPGGCGAEAPVALTAVRRKEGGLVTLQPAATLRCAAARTVAAYLRDDLAAGAARSGATLARVDVAASYVCRGRNNVRGAKLSEHGRANALDIGGFGFADGSSLDVYAAGVPKGLVDALKPAACQRFNTVLGPGSDGYHEDHLHVDLQPRRFARSKLCRWSGS